jgi:hypothetical protein
MSIVLSSTYNKVCLRLSVEEAAAVQMALALTLAEHPCPLPRDASVMCRSLVRQLAQVLVQAEVAQTQDRTHD